MKLARYAVLAALALFSAAQTQAQSRPQTKTVFKARLSPVPADVRTRADLTGSGSVTAVLEGSKLALTGSFDGLKTAAIAAALHSAVAAGVRGPVIADLTLPHATSGALAGAVELTPQQIASLHHGGLYVEIHSEKSPDGVLWGWLLKGN